MKILISESILKILKEEESIQTGNKLEIKWKFSQYKTVQETCEVGRIVDKAIEFIYYSYIDNPDHPDFGKPTFKHVFWVPKKVFNKAEIKNGVYILPFWFEAIPRDYKI